MKRPPDRPSIWPAILTPAVLGFLIAIAATTFGNRGLLFVNATGTEIPWDLQAKALNSPGARNTSGTPGPLYPHLLNAMGMTRGAAPARSRQLVLLGGLVPLLAALAGWRLRGRATALVAGFLALAAGSFWVHAAWLVPTAWQAAAGLAAIVCLSGAKPPGPAASFMAGLSVGLAGLLGAAWAGALAIFIAIRELVRRRVLPAALVLAGALVLFAAPMLKPGGGGPGLPPSLAGLDAFLGFHPGASGLDTRRIDSPEWRWLSPTEMLLKLSRETGESPDRGHPNAIFAGAAIRWATGHPIEAIGLIARKTFLMIQGYDPPTPESLLFRSRESVPWARPLLPAATVILGFGIAGLIVARDRRAPYGLLALAVILTAAFGVVRSSDRLALILALAAPAAAVLVDVSNRRNAAIGAGLTVLLALPWFVLPARYESEADNHFFLGATHDRMKRPAEALSELERASQLDPRHVGARLTLAGALARDGLNDQAAIEAEAALAEAPEFTQGWRLLARLQQTAGRYDGAAKSWLELARLDPKNAEVQNNLGTVYAALGRYDDAVRALEEALVLDPAYREAGINLTELKKRGPEGLTGVQLQTEGPGSAVQQIQAGVAEAMQRLQGGDAAGAEAKIAELRASFGATPDIDFASANLALQKSQYPQAIELYERARTQMGNNPFLLLNLGAAYAQSGRVQEAIPLFEEVLRLDPTNATARQNLDAARAALGSGAVAP